MKVSLEVRLLSGRPFKFDVQPDTTLRDVRRLMQTELSIKVNLLFRGVKVSQDATLASLGITPAEFLVAIPSGSKSKAKAPMQRTASEGIQLQQSKHTSSALPKSASSPPGALDLSQDKASAPSTEHLLDTEEPSSYTLLPGYTSRPNISPDKRTAQLAQDPPQEGGFCAAVHEAAVAEPHPDSQQKSTELTREMQGAPILQPEEEPVTKGSAPQQERTEADQEEEQKPRARKRARKFPPRVPPKPKFQGTGSVGLARKLWEEPVGSREAALLRHLPLPPVLERLELIFTALNTVYSFLLNLHVQATWTTVRAAILQNPKCADACPADIQNMSALCPEVLSLRDRQRTNTSPQSVREMRSWGAATLAKHGAQNHNQTAPAGASSSAECDERKQSEQRSGSSTPVKAAAEDVMAIDTDGCGTLLAGDEDRFIIEIIDPGRRRTPATASRSTLQASDPLAGPSGDVAEEPGLNSRSLGSQPAPHKSSAPTDGATNNANARRATAFRQGLTRAVAKLHEDFVKALLKQDSTGKKEDSGGRKQRGAKTQPRPPVLSKKFPPCTDTTPMAAPAFLEHLQQLPWYQGQAQHFERVSARLPKHAMPQFPLSAASQKALADRGIAQLFSHQARAVDAVISGDHVVVCTSTASGKSLCYALPIIEALSENRNSCALLMFPTKALAQDQLRALRLLLTSAFGAQAPKVEVYDGDTAKADRADVRDSTQILITNPDMLHMSILPVHKQFARLLSNLRYVVVDEGHAYRGVFGCHTALVLRRLRRLCHREYRTDPRFVVTSATIANPDAHTAMLLGVPKVRCIAEDGSPHGPKTFVLWNPPLTKPNGGDSQANLSHTENRLRTRITKRAKSEWLRAELQEAHQERGRGVRLAQSKDDVWGLSEADWTAAVALGKRRRSAAASAVAMINGIDPTDTEALRAVRGNTSSAPAGTQQDAAGQAMMADASVESVERLEPTKPAKAAAPVDRAARAAAMALVEATVVHRPQDGYQHTPLTIAHRHDDPSGTRPLLKRCTTNIQGLQPSGEQEGATAQQRLPGGGEWKERHGANGVQADKRRSSPIVELSLLLAECIQHGLRTIAFCKTRKLCELVTAYTRETLRTTAPSLTNSISVYRAGYSPQERREIEAALFSGQLMAVAATNALELGVDVGSLDVTLHLGFPGSVASLWQQAGRAGRREQASTSIYIAFDGPLDQYYFNNPPLLFGRAIEQSQVDPGNAQLMMQHVACAGLELPVLLEEDQAYFGHDLPHVAQHLKSLGLLSRHPEMRTDHSLHYVGPQSNPASSVSLRAIDPERYSIINEADGTTLEEIEESKAFYEVYDGAVYMYQGRTYLCKKLDMDSKVAVVRPADLKYYTKVRDYCDVHVTGGRAYYPAAVQSMGLATSAQCAECEVTTRWMGFVRIWQGSGEAFDMVDLFLPDVQITTQAAYVRVPATARLRVREANCGWRDGLHAASHAMLNCVPLHLLCDSGDMGTECDNPYDSRFRPERLLLYDKHPGGIGLASQACPIFGALMQKALELVTACTCASDSGCPSCIQNADCGEYNAVLSKKAAAIVLQATLEAETEYRYRTSLQEEARLAASSAAGGFHNTSADTLPAASLPAIMPAALPKKGG
ncbi:hypothetical protein WJX73_000198 [Symbiochloris irregularis]|uniref:Uncharacterized protein n=1 Tax=Symbiochloris irregularis TaxID=706552 RepID=A0AAW1NTH3_9CHLO